MNNTSGLKNKTVIITGRNSGIGRSTALQFAKLGANVLITGRRSRPLKKVVDKHSNIESFRADVSRSEDAPETIEKALKLWNRLDVLVNNAGAGAPASLESVTEDTINTIFSTNVIGPSLLAKAALPHLEASGGSIINVSSTFGHKAAGGISHYAASKAALEHLTRCWALELASHNIRVNSVAPGPTETAALEEMMGLSQDEATELKEQEREQIPLGRRGHPDEVARWIVKLADSCSNWITGQVISVDGGLTVS